MKIINDLKLDFNDVLIRPKRSELSSRSEVDLIRNLTFKYSNYNWNGVPIICSNMDTISTISMYNKISEFKMLMCFHKSIDCHHIIQHNCDPNHFMLSTGISDDDLISLKLNINKLDGNDLRSLNAADYKFNLKEKSKLVLEKLKKVKSYGKKNSSQS